MKCASEAALQELKELKDSNALFVTAEDVRNILEADPATVRRQAMTDGSVMGFNVSVIGNRTRIPRKAFLRWLGEL